MTGTYTRGLTAALEAAQSDPGRGCMLGNTATEMLPADDDARRSVQRAFADLEAGFTEALIRGQEAGEVRADLDERFRYVMVDEYQDTNRAQYVILRALSSDYPNLAVTGELCRNVLLADVPAIIGSIDIVMGEVDR